LAVTVFTPASGGGTSSQINLSLYTRAGQDVTADVVQGQPNFAANSANNPLMPGANRLYFPYGVAVDAPSGRLFVADTSNQRVLSWPNAPAFANGQPADLVLGQPDFLAHGSNNGGVSAKGLSLPTGVALDAQGDLYVADYSNNRVLEYDAPLSSGMAAGRVFGQPDFTHNTANNGGVSANSLYIPNGVALDAQGNLYVADTGNNRVLEYNAPPTTDRTADHVFGQPDFTHNTENNGGVSANSLLYPEGVELDRQGNLYVADTFNSRVLEYDWALAKIDLPLVRH
jgi:sugar lactone lactonase YvrE